MQHISKNSTIVTETSTEDQLKLLKYDNIKSENYKTNFDLKLDKIENSNLKLINIVIIGDRVVNLQTRVNEKND